jgi:hypothetical protein
MSRDRRRSGAKKSDRRVRPTGAHRRWLLAAGAGVVLAVAVGAAWLALRDRKPPANATLSPVVARSDGKVEAQRLVGNWLRPDGGYVLGILKVDPSGRVEAAYANPRPIHVARAVASSTGNTMKLFVELQDVGYPGSTYDLTYDPNDDSMKGIYFQAQIQQRFDVVFVRMKGAGS